MTPRLRPVLLLVALILAAAGAAFWRARPTRTAAHDEQPLPAASSPASRAPPFSPAASAPSASPSAPVVTPQGPVSEPAGAPDASSRSSSEPDVERRQDAKIARGLTDGESGGVLVVAIPPGSVAGALHLKPGDLITAVNGQPLTSTEQFVQRYRTEGLPTQLTVQREGREVHLH